MPSEKLSGGKPTNGAVGTLSGSSRVGFSYTMAAGSYIQSLRRQALEAPETAEVGVYMHPVGGSARKISRLLCIVCRGELSPSRVVSQQKAILFKRQINIQAKGQGFRMQERGFGGLCEARTIQASEYPKSATAPFPEVIRKPLKPRGQSSCKAETLWKS